MSRLHLWAVEEEPQLRAHPARMRFCSRACAAACGACFVVHGSSQLSALVVDLIEAQHDYNGGCNEDIRSGKEEGAQASPYVGIHTFTSVSNGWLRNLQQDDSGYHHHRRCVVTANYCDSPSSVQALFKAPRRNPRGFPGFDLFLLLLQYHQFFVNS